MIKLIVTYLLLFPLTILAQVEIINTSLTETRLNLLYKGIDNIIEISGLDYDTSLILSSTSGEGLKSIWNKKSNIFIVRAGNAEMDTLKLYRSGQLILSKIFEVKKINSPSPKLGNLTDTIATIQQILENPTLNVVIPDCYYDHRFRVINFKMMLLQENKDTLKTFEKTFANQFTNAQTETISGLNQGDKIVFTEITATCADCALRRFSPFTITIK